MNPIAIGDRFIRQEILLTPEEALLTTFNDLDEEIHQCKVDREKVDEGCKSKFNKD